LSIIRDVTFYKGFALLNGSRNSLTKKRPPLQEAFILLSLIFHSAFIQNINLNGIHNYGPDCNNFSPLRPISVVIVPLYFNITRPKPDL
jgi:hypothetical protein